MCGSVGGDTDYAEMTHSHESVGGDTDYAEMTLALAWVFFFLGPFFFGFVFLGMLIMLRDDLGFITVGFLVFVLPYIYFFVCAFMRT